MIVMMNCNAKSKADNICSIFKDHFVEAYGMFLDNNLTPVGAKYHGAAVVMSGGDSLESIVGSILQI